MLLSASPGGLATSRSSMASSSATDNVRGPSAQMMDEYGLVAVGVGDKVGVRVRVAVGVAVVVGVEVVVGVKVEVGVLVGVGVTSAQSLAVRDAQMSSK